MLNSSKSLEPEQKALSVSGVRDVFTWVGLQPVYLDLYNVQSIVEQKGLLKYADKCLLDIDGVAGLHTLVPILFIDYFAKWTKPPEAFANLLKRLGISPELATADFRCFEFLLCRRTNQLVAIPRLRANGPFSPARFWCSVKSSVSRLVGSFAALHESKTAGFLCAWDITYPEEISHMLLNEFEPVLKRADKCVQVFVKKVEREFFGGDRLCVHYNTHPWATKNPHKPHLHHHLNFPNCVRNKRGELVRIQPGFFRGKDPDPEKLEKLRQLWWASIVETFGKVIPVDRFVVDLFIRYISLKNRPKLIHRLKYCSRRPSSDFFQHYSADVCPTQHFRFVLDLLNFRNSRKHVGWAIGSMVNVQRVPNCFCPICHGEAVKLGCGSELPEGFHLVIWGGGFWEHLPPPIKN